jgi:ribosome maturation factor RimP
LIGTQAPCGPFFVCFGGQVLQERLTILLEPALEALGYELILLELQSGRGSSLLRLYIDSPGGVTLKDCTRVSREVSSVMDVEDPIQGAYQLEVSSPGLDRPLVKIAHFERFMGEQAKVQLLAPSSSGRRRFVGAICAVNERAVVLDTADGRVELEFSEIERARLVPDFERENVDS